jgi:hypothetical protein
MLTYLLAAAMTLPLGVDAPDDPEEFSQGIDYRIEAVLDEATDVLRGRARLHYTNNAPVAIDTLWLHQHLNAFRPNSAWAERELEFGERRFADLGPDEHAFERFRSVEIDGVRVQPHYPGAPDSTVVALPLPAPLAPGATATVLMDWDARLSTTPRRQGRAGRQYDFAQWYPRIAVFDADGWHYHPLMPQGEFFGEFGSYDVTLEIRDDQVIGATGVPVEGDPGWQRVAAPGHGDRIVLRRDAYPAMEAESLGLLTGSPGDGMRRIRWRAQEVHHFAWSISPEFVYEGGVWRDIPVHVLYQRQAAEEWGNGVALERTYLAMEWTDHLFGRYLWPQITNLHRIESGGTEFPMLIMDGSASEGLIVHEIVHQYAHGILANNEWRDGWLDEGLTSFLTNWYWEETGRPEQEVWQATMTSLREMERAGRTQPVALPDADFVDFPTYIAMAYRKPAVVFRMLRWMVGEETMLEVMRTYYERNKLSHVDEGDLREAVSLATGQDFDWFFDQWIHTTRTLDYTILGAATQRTADGRWRTVVDVYRMGEAWMPVTLEVGDETRLLESRDRRQRVEIITRERPEEAVLDPEDVLLDIDPTNNRRPVQVVE